MTHTLWSDGSNVCWAVVANIRSGGQTGGPAAAGGVFVSVFDQQQHFVWRDDNGTIWDAWFDGPSNVWRLQQLNVDPNPKPSGKTNAPPAIGDPFVSVFDQQQHFTWRSSGGAIWDAWFDSGNGQWSSQQIDGPAAAGDPFVWVIGGQQHFTYQTIARDIADIWFNDATGAWNVQQLTGSDGLLPFAPPAFKGPFASVFGNQQHVTYVDAGGSLWDLWFDGRGWKQQQLCGDPGSLTPGPRSATSPFVSVFGQQQHFVYKDEFGLLWDAWFDSASSAWQLQQLNCGGATDGPLASTGAFVDVIDQQQHFAYLDEQGGVWDLWFDGGQNRWSKQQLSQRGFTNGPAATMRPFISQFAEQQHFVYADAVGGIWDAWFDETRNAWNLQQVNGRDGEMLTDALANAMWKALGKIDLSKLPAIP